VSNEARPAGATTFEAEPAAALRSGRSCCAHESRDCAGRTGIPCRYRTLSHGEDWAWWAHAYAGIDSQNFRLRISVALNTSAATLMAATESNLRSGLKM